MLKDADHSYFAGVYIVCGYTDLRFGIDSLAAIIERRFHINLFVPNTCSFSVASLPPRSRVCSGKVMVFFSFTSAWNLVISHGHVLPTISGLYLRSSSNG